MTDADRRLHDRFGAEITFAGQPLDALALEIASTIGWARVVRIRGLELHEHDQLELAASLGTIVGRRPGLGGPIMPNVRYERGTDLYAHRWHADQSWATSDAWTLLSCVEGDATAEPTLFIDTSSGLSSLSDELSNRMGDRTVTHDVRNSRRLRPVLTAQERPEPLYDRIRRRLAQSTARWATRDASGWPLLVPAQGHRDGTTYPLVDRCPLTGKPHLRVGDHAWSVSGLDPDRSIELLDDIHAALETRDRVFRQSWRRGDLVVFDNRMVLHRRESEDAAAPGRVLRRVLAVPDK